MASAASAWLSLAVLSGASGIGGLLLVAAGASLPWLASGCRSPALPPARLRPPLLAADIGRGLLAGGVALVLTSASAAADGLFVALLALAAASVFAPARGRAAASLALAALSLAMAGDELRRWPLPRIPLQPGETVVVIGDSLSAGLAATDHDTWPRQLESGLGTPVRNLAHAGATSRTALDQVAAVPPGPAVVLIEIGGNDLLDGGRAADFERDLDVLLRAASGPGHRLLLFELPVPPLHGRWLRIQRLVAARQGCRLLPRRVLASALLQPDSLDGLHLSPAGHGRLASLAAKVLARPGD